MNFYRLILLLVLVYSLSVQAVIRKIPVAQSILIKIEKLVEHGKNLHEASYTQDKKRIARVLEEISQHINMSKNIIINDNLGAQHLLKLMDAIKENSEKALPQTGQEQRDTLNIVFQKIANITQGYYVGNYRTFFCQKHKNLWIQRAWVVQNPVHPTSRCGGLAN